MCYWQSEVQSVLKSSFLAHHFQEASSRERRPVQHSSLVAQRKTPRKKRYHFHYFVHCPITADQLLFSTWVFQDRSEQPISRQKTIITDGVNVASLLTIYFYQHRFPKAKIPAEEIQEALQSADTQLWSKLKFICWTHFLKKKTFWSWSN